MSNKILRFPAVEGQSGTKRSTIYLRIKQGLWTKPLRLGPRMVGWPAAEIDALIAARIAQKSDAEIQALVTRLEAARSKSWVEGADLFLEKEDGTSLDAGGGDE